MKYVMKYGANIDVGICKIVLEMIHKHFKVVY